MLYLCSNYNNKKAEVPMLISDKVDFSIRNIKDKGNISQW